MFIELIDLLRCTRPHEDSWLVATFYRMRGREVVGGLLSCPICSARYPVKDGVAYFDPEAVPAPPAAPARPERRGEEDATRVAAYLNLVEPGVVVVGGAWGAVANALAQLGNTVIALNSASEAEEASHIRSSGLPVARESMDGIALDSRVPELVESAARALKTGARIVVPVAAQLPREVRQLAGDDKWLVAVKEGSTASAPVQIARK